MPGGRAGQQQVAEPRDTRRRTRIHWPALVVVLLSLAAALGLHGYVTGELADAGRVRPPGPADQVPSSIATGGPIIGAHAGTLNSLRVPAKTVVLTFDDGPDPTWTPQILDVLAREDVPATFFLLGSQTLRYPDIVRRETAEGLEVGNHSFRHPDLTNQPVWEQRWQLAQQELALVGVTGRTTSLMRPPYSFSPDSLDNEYWKLLQDSHAHGYVTVLADVDARDWERPGVDAIVRNAIPKDGKGAVILLHDAGGDRSQTVAALPLLIKQLRAKGYQFTTISQVAHVQPYKEAETGELWRGRALLWATEGSQIVATLMAVAFLLAGALTLLRLLLMVVTASGHQRSRRHRVWGPPVVAPVSVVVPAYNEKEGIEAAIDSIVASDHPVEVVVVDDGSTDGTADLVAALGLPEVTLIRQDNAGKPAALNAGIHAARHDVLVLVDGDTRFEPETVRRLVQPMADPRVGAVSGNAKVGNRHGLLGRWQHIEYVMGFNLDRRLYDVLRCMPTVPGAVGAFRRAALLDVGGVSDETLAEDTDLTAAVVRAGWQVVYEEGARAWTEAPSSWGQLWKQRYRWCYGTLQAMWKHRRAIVERGDSGRFGRRGLLVMLLFQVLLPLTAPAMDAFLLYGLFFLDLPTTVLLWSGFLGAQLATAGYAFRLDRESPVPLWTLPLQQVVYRQLMYLVVIQSVFTALAGMRLPWEKLRRTGDVQLPGESVGPERELRP
jgi:cellulose synthase/poly-beta-1,6-N-acetylglucosamine synthase-like glycosyltransferase/peptidoglycan/xylan/chitin deacetylase (PgdA/CDA1 family)